MARRQQLQDGEQVHSCIDLSAKGRLSVPHSLPAGPFTAIFACFLGNMVADPPGNVNFLHKG